MQAFKSMYTVEEDYYLRMRALLCIPVTQRQVHAHARACTHTRTHTQVHTRTHTHTHTHTHKCMQARVHTHTHTHTHMHKYIQMYVCTHSLKETSDVTRRKYHIDKSMPTSSKCSTALGYQNEKANLQPTSCLNLSDYSSCLCYHTLLLSLPL